ncbi:MAG: ABC transporter permease, partial [Anaerolineales bacterium]|nr:ABC transporter permease [Anaerolineales bacterium]
MLFSENFKVAIRALRANKLRSILTMLGIVIGVATVVALLSIGKGATASITSQIQSSGSNLLTVSPGRMQQGPQSNGSQGQSYLYYADYQLLERTLTDSIDALAPSYQTSYLVNYGSESFNVNVTGITDDYQKTNSYEVTDGRFISDGDNKSQALVAVLGSQTAQDLFGGLNPIGKIISITGVKFEVIGVLEEKGSSGFGSADDAVFIPLETGYNKLFGSTATYNDKKIVNGISVSVTNADDMDTVKAQIEFLLRRSHKLASTDELDFNVLSQSDLLSTLTSVTQIL